ncbi:envelope glycoprotein N [Pteropodid alphaherpesvirus 1]|uniref:Envelope glycoprotein N n=1 Tax=Pteropodid alphaherpesvirus 1 TaxID=1343901 RepID=A0A060Q0W7_9ALPH|nr:envelope glycoprotein N [Pteropodid alphaherpesvirus 1]BAP00729.1 envelope glycoprotein N [Pteropodid alphaherpesvirus 1]
MGSADWLVNVGLVVALVCGSVVGASEEHAQAFWSDQCSGHRAHSSPSGALGLFYLGMLSMGVSLSACLYRIGTRAWALADQ